MNFLSPFSMPLKFEAPSAQLIGKPKKSPSHSGWGEPYIDPTTGARIFPGTEGGADPFTSLGKIKEVWKEKKSGLLQSVGNIAWRGKHKMGPTSPRVVVSFTGPPSRCFHTQIFTYGQDSNEKYVYKDGGVIAIAPSHVTGAAITKLAPSKIGGAGDALLDYLVVVVFDGSSERLMVRPLGFPLRKSAISAEESALLVSLKSEDNQDGWVLIGNIGITGYGAPTVPWLFNEDGTEAQTIRMKTKVGRAPSGSDVEELAGDRVKLTFIEGILAVANMGNFPPYEMGEFGSIASAGVYSSPPDDYDGTVHTWQEMINKSEISATGKQVVAVDYIGNTEVIVSLVLDTKYYYQLDHMKGLDAPPPPANPYNNNGKYGNPDELGCAAESYPGDHRGSKWLGGKLESYLSYVVGGVETRILLEYSSQYTSDTIDGRPFDPLNAILFYREVFVQRVRYLDVRSGGFVAFRGEQLRTFPQPAWGTVGKFEGYDINFSDSSLNVIESSDSDWQYVDESDVVPASQGATSWGILWPLVGASWLWSATSYLGVRPTDNDSNAIGYVGFKNWFPPGQTLLWSGWFGVELLRHEHHTKDCGFVQLESGELIVSGDFIHPKTGTLSSVLFSTPFDVGALTGGASFHPLGEV